MSKNCSPHHNFRNFIELSIFIICTEWFRKILNSLKEILHCQFIKEIKRRKPNLQKNISHNLFNFFFFNK